MMDNFSSILRDPHFCQFAEIISAPFSMHWRQRHPEMPFWTRWEECASLLNEQSFASKSARTQFIERFSRLITSLVQADDKLFYRESDLDWFSMMMSQEQALVAMSMLFAIASSKPAYLTPAQIAEATNTSESNWRNKAAADEFIGAIKLGKQWLIPVNSLRASGINIEMRGTTLEEDMTEE